MQIRAERLLGVPATRLQKFTLSHPLNGSLGYFFTEQLPKRAFEARLLREILAYNADRIAGFFRQSLYCAQKTRGV